MTFADYQADAPLHINSYLKAGISSIDELLGKGYAAAHPELLSAYITACVADVASNITQDNVAGSIADVARAIQAAGEAVSGRL